MIIWDQMIIADDFKKILSGEIIRGCKVGLDM